MVLRPQSSLPYDRLHEIIRGSLGSFIQSAKNQPGHNDLILTSQRQRATAAMTILGMVIVTRSDRGTSFLGNRDSFSDFEKNLSCRGASRCSLRQNGQFSLITTAPRRACLIGIYTTLGASPAGRETTGGNRSEVALFSSVSRHVSEVSFPAFHSLRFRKRLDTADATGLRDRNCVGNLQGSEWCRYQ